MLTEANDELQTSNTWTGPLEPVPRCSVTVMPRKGKGAEPGAREVCITCPDLTDADYPEDLWILFLGSDVLALIFIYRILF